MDVRDLWERTCSGGYQYLYTIKSTTFPLFFGLFYDKCIAWGR